jgi:hypothetical protein
MAEEKKNEQKYQKYIIVVPERDEGEKIVQMRH